MGESLSATTLQKSYGKIVPIEDEETRTIRNICDQTPGPGSISGLSDDATEPTEFSFNDDLFVHDCDTFFAFVDWSNSVPIQADHAW